MWGCVITRLSFAGSFESRCTRRCYLEWMRRRICSSACRSGTLQSDPVRCSCSHQDKRERLKSQENLSLEPKWNFFCVQTSIINAAVELHHHGSSVDLVDELRKCFFAGWRHSDMDFWDCLIRFKSQEKLFRFVYKFSRLFLPCRLEVTRKTAKWREFQPQNSQKISLSGMGKGQSKPRTVSFDNESPGIIDISEDVVSRLKRDMQKGEKVQKFVWLIE